MRLRKRAWEVGAISNGEMAREVVIVSATRTPVGRRNGALRDVHPVMLAAQTLREVVRRSGAEPGRGEDDVWGGVSPVG